MMFHVNRWATVYVNVLGDNAGAGLNCLRALIPAVKNIPGAFLFGYTAGRRLEKIMRESAAGLAEGEELEYTIRFITMLIEKNRFGNVDRILERIEKIIDERKGILELTAETAFPPDKAFEEEIKQQVARRLGAAGIKMKWQLAPELLGGYRLRIGGFYVDASLKGQTEKMAAELAAAASAGC